MTLNFLTRTVMIFVFSISNYPYIDQKTKNEKNKNGFDFFAFFVTQSPEKCGLFPTSKKKKFSKTRRGDLAQKWRNFNTLKLKFLT